MSPCPDFLFATCRAGSEATLKREVASLHGGVLTPAFMRPQLITWKAKTALRPDFQLQAAFAHVSGWSIGRAQNPTEILPLLEKHQVSVSDLHVFPRCHDEEGVSADTWAQMDAIQAEISAAIPLVKTSPYLLDVIIGEPSEPWFIGLHTRSADAHPSPGALPRTPVPPEAPSRAWLKMEQSLTWLGLTQNPASLRGQTALELGSAPGGASWSLLQRGMEVIGVDTGLMDPRVLSHPHYHHIPQPAGELSFRSLPPRVDLLASDMTLQPGLALKYIERLTRQLYPRYLVLTLKMNDTQVESQIPSLLQQIRRFGPGEVHARQLPANRREITVICQ